MDDSASACVLSVSPPWRLRLRQFGPSDSVVLMAFTREAIPTVLVADGSTGSLAAAWNSPGALARREGNQGHLRCRAPSVTTVSIRVLKPLVGAGDNVKVPAGPPAPSSRLAGHWD